MTAILAVDDDRNLLKIICDMLEGPAVDIITASNAEAALSAMNSQAFNLVISDLKMPGKSEMDVLAFSLKKNPSVPVTMISAFGRRIVGISCLLFSRSTRPAAVTTSNKIYVNQELLMADR